MATQVLIAQCTEAEDLGLSSKSDTWEGTRDTGWDLLRPGCCARSLPWAPGVSVSRCTDSNLTACRQGPGRQWKVTETQQSPVCCQHSEPMTGEEKGTWAAQATPLGGSVPGADAQPGWSGRQFPARTVGRCVHVRGRWRHQPARGVGVGMRSRLPRSARRRRGKRGGQDPAARVPARNVRAEPQCPKARGSPSFRTVCRSAPGGDLHRRRRRMRADAPRLMRAPQATL